MSVHNKLNKLCFEYGLQTEEDLVEPLKKKFPKEYKLALKDLKDEGVDDPEMEMTAGRIADHIGDNEDKLLSECEKVLKNL